MVCFQKSLRFHLILWISRQVVTDAWEYDWSIFRKDESIDFDLKDIALEVWKNAYDIWFTWICWLDFLKDKNWDYFLIDPNFRLTWATSWILLKKQIFWETDFNEFNIHSFKSSFSDVKAMVNEFNKLWKEWLYLISTCRNNISNVTSWFCIIWWENQNEIYLKKNLFYKKWIKI